MRVIVASRDQPAADWLARVLQSAGLSVVVLEDPKPTSPDLTGGDLLIADRASSDAIGRVGPGRRILLVLRGEVIDVSSAMEGGFMDLLVVPSPEDEILSRVSRALDHFLKPAQGRSEEDQAHVRELAEIVERVTTALRNAAPRARQPVHELAEDMLSVFLLLIDSHETNERGTPGHSRRVGVVVRALAERLGHGEKEAGWLELAGRLQDIGFLPLGLPLSKESLLSLELRRSVERHADLSAEILGPLATWGLPVGAIRDHHERLDGAGYPRGLKGDDVSMGAQILGAADVFEALTSKRPWRPAEDRAAALQAMRTMGGFSRGVMDALEGSADLDLEQRRPPPSPPGNAAQEREGEEPDA